jgi:hypothetical protein
MNTRLRRVQPPGLIHNFSGRPISRAMRLAAPEELHGLGSDHQPLTHTVHPLAVLSPLPTHTMCGTARLPWQELVGFPLREEKSLHPLCAWEHKAFHYVVSHVVPRFRGGPHAP